LPGRAARGLTRDVLASLEVGVNDRRLVRGGFATPRALVDLERAVHQVLPDVRQPGNVQPARDLDLVLISARRACRRVMSEGGHGLFASLEYYKRRYSFSRKCQAACSV